MQTSLLPLTMVVGRLLPKAHALETVSTLFEMYHDGQ